MVVLRLMVMILLWLMIVVLIGRADQVASSNTWIRGTIVRVLWYPADGADSADVIVWDAQHRRRIVLAQSVPVNAGQATVRIPDSLPEHRWYRLLIVGGRPARLVHQEPEYRAIVGGNEKVTPQEPTKDADTLAASIHPNPAAERSVVTWPWLDVQRILVRSVHGKVVGATIVDNVVRAWTMPVAEWPVGVYTVELHRRRGVERASLVVLR
jgi:hypothetical protein